MELGEEHAELLHLPRWTFPAATPASAARRCARTARSVTSATWCTRTRTAASAPHELAEVSAELDALHGVREERDGARGCVQDVYARKFTADYSVEMDRSVTWWVERWLHGEAGGTPKA